MNNRDPKQIKYHYEVEKKLAERLKNTSREERRSLYSLLYDELYKLVPDHPQLMRKVNPEEKKRKTLKQLVFLRRFLKPDDVFLEIGPGDCSLSYEVAKCVRQVYAADVSSEITRSEHQPENFKLIIIDGTDIPLLVNSVNVAYSNQLIEHLHSEDALEQTQSVCKSLVKDGVYICITPHRYSGPHDVSKYFDPVATGFHLKEYTHRELAELMKKAGFRKVRIYIGRKGRYIVLPRRLIYWFEWCFSLLPYQCRKSVSRKMPFMSIFGAIMVGVK